MPVGQWFLLGNCFSGLYHLQPSRCSDPAVAWPKGVWLPRTLVTDLGIVYALLSCGVRGRPPRFQKIAWEAQQEISEKAVRGDERMKPKVQWRAQEIGGTTKMEYLRRKDSGSE